MNGSYLGPEFSDDEVESQLRAAGAQFERLTPGELIESCAQDLAEEATRSAGFQGRMEFGPRALEVPARF